MIYETDTDMLALWNGSSWRYIAATTPTNGTVLQTVTAELSTAAFSSSTSYADTGLTATITPKSSSSKVLVITANQIAKTAGNTDNGVNLRILRGATTIQENKFALFTGTTVIGVGCISMVSLDSPATTSATTYKVQFANVIAASRVEYSNNTTTSTIVLMEIAA
jgi:hypothetical protein